MGFGNVVVIGQPPSWYIGESVTAQDYDGRKQYTIYQKILIGCELNNVTDDFIMFNDDHFLLKPLYAENIKYWHNGPIANEMNRNLTARYAHAVENTINILPDAMNFDIHIPIIYNKAKFKMLFGNKNDEVCVKTYYCESLQLQGEEMADCKIDQLLSYEAIKEYIKDRMFFSTSINSIKAPMRAVLEDMFKEKSRWEK